MLTDVYSEYNIRIMSRVCGVDPQSLRYWTRQGLLKPLKREKCRGTPMLFSFTELLKARVISRLRLQNVPLQRIRRALDALERFNFADSEVFLVIDGDDIWAETDKKQLISLVESCGQLLFINIARQRAEVEVELRMIWPANDTGGLENADNV
jgi:DNA-binding transcriptional MerR regulator